MNKTISFLSSCQVYTYLHGLSKDNIEIKVLTSLFKNSIVGNKAKGRISKRVFQESKARQNFRKTNISYLLIRTPVLERLELLKLNSLYIASKRSSVGFFY